MGVLDTQEILDTLQDLLRSSDVISISTRGVTTETETFSGDDIETEFTTSGHINNIRSVTVGSTTLYNYKDFTTDYDNSTVTFNTAPATGTDNIEIVYDSGTTNGDNIYCDYPRDDLTISSFPRVGMGIVSISSEDVDIQHTITQSQVLVQIIAYAEKKVEINNMLTTIRTALRNRNKTAGNIRFITPNGLGPILPANFTNANVFQGNIDILLPVEFER